MDEVLEFHDGMISPVDAVRTGWSSLREVMRSWGVFHRGDLTQWLRGHGFAGAQPGNHIPARAQEYFFEEACRVLRSIGCIWAMGPVGFSRSVRVHVASGAHVEVVPSVSQVQVASMLEPCVAREVQSEARGRSCASPEALVLSVVTSWPNGSKILRKVDGSSCWKRLSISSRP